ncbi:fibroblast growth factor receptor 4-like isoform X2 [Pocillopora verrucosa]|uniref:fibroblast growth factor receptor 4-like isoform X2 n=1 Tax=Pocillopora verrucosa TaxID=203993 RepID=UPI003340C9AB
MAWSSWSAGCKGCVQTRQRVEFNCSRTQETRPCKCPPEINSRREKSVKFNSTLQMDCLVKGFPKPEVNWTRDGKLLNTTNKLTIKQVTYGDAGQYTCSAKNSEGKREAAFRVTVTGPPEINPQLINQSVTYNSPLQFNCSLRGFPTPEVHWTKDGMHLGKKNTLTIHQARFEDSGEYTCSAKNPIGSKKSTFWIEVKKVPPRVNNEFLNFTIAFNSTFTKECYLRGDPQISVNWTKDGVLLSKNNTLIIRQATLKDKGHYECTAKNDYGKANSSFWIDVTASPQIIEPPINQSVTEGNSVNFSCRASGVPTPTLVWVFNNADLPSGINQFNHEGESFLEFLSVTKGMEGTYKCEAKNKENTTSSSASLRVYGKASAQVVPGQYSALISGDNFTLTCIVNEETINVTWKKKGSAPPERAKIDTRLDDKKSKLVITEVVKEDSGVYSCEARNKLGFVARSFVKINVKVPPRVSNEFRNLTIAFNSTFTKECYLRGDPEVSVNWTKDGVLLSKNNTLIIRQATLKDRGNYECTAKNDYGEANSSFWIDVTASPQITEPPINQSVTEGNSVNFSCRASGVPTPTLVWVFNNADLPSGINQFNHEGESFLEFLSVTKGMEGTYKCEAKNKENTTSSSASLRVYGKASAQVIPGQYSALISGDNFTLTCIVNEETINVTWKKKGSAPPERAKIDTQLDDKKSKLVITEVVKVDSGVYSCEARNKLGFVARSFVKINVKVPPRVSNEFRNLTIAFNSTFTKECYLRGDPEVSVNWTKDGVLLSKNNTLIIRQATLKDRGNYECTAKNDYGEANSSFWIDVTASPQIRKPPINQSVTEGNSVNFSCRASGVPTPTLVWVFNNADLPSGINQFNHEGESFLEFLSVTKGMEGTYKCEAKNKENTTSSSASLRVYGKASAQVVPDQYPALTAGDNLTLTCIVNEETMNVTWKKDGDSPPERAKIDTRFDDKKSKFVITEVVKEHSGVYSCEARNKLGFVARSFVKINVKAKQVPRAMQSFNTLWYYIGGTVAAAIIISLIAWYFCKRRRTVTALPDQEQAIKMEPFNAEVDEWEVAVNRVLLQDVIGRGAFGAVWRALLSSPNGQPGNRTVAAKCFTPTAGEEGRKCLMREIELGKLINKNVSPNIVKFMGCVTTEIHPILIMEYMPCGDLLGYLRKCRGVRDRFYLGEGRAQNLNNYDLVLFAKQIAAGMVFLGTRGIIHRDLAARNILLDNNYVCKVTDFGMAYQSFKYGHGNAKKGRLPIKWTAPEILLGELAGLSALSDVWSYGIVLYEIVTLGGIPYDRWSEAMVIAEVTKGYQMPKPDHVDNKLYDIMKRCWNRNPDFRPPFENLRQRMDKYIREETYLELLDMGAYDKAKYSRVEDLGDEDAEPSEEVAKKASAKGLGRSASDRR